MRNYPILGLQKMDQSATSPMFQLVLWVLTVMQRQSTSWQVMGSLQSASNSRIRLATTNSQSGFQKQGLVVMI